MDAAKKPAERLLDVFVALMVREGYTYRKSNHCFEKAFEYGKYEYVLFFDARGGFVGVDAGFFVHFEVLEEQFKKALGYSCPWTAGAMLLMAGARPWKFWLHEEQFAAMSPKERAGIPSEVVFPQRKIEACAQFLMEAHARFAVPFFQGLQTYRQLAEFYRACIQNGFSGHCPPADRLVYMALLVAAATNGDVGEIVASAEKLKGVYADSDMGARIQALRRYTESVDLKSLFASTVKTRRP
jgi:hypothetical protein